MAIDSVNGKFGGLRTANVSYWSSKGVTGVSAPGVEFQRPVYVGDIEGMGWAKPTLERFVRDGVDVTAEVEIRD